MSYDNSDFVDSILDALDIDTEEDGISEQADLVLERIAELKREALATAVVDKMSHVEECIIWAKQQGYCFADKAARQYGLMCQREWHEAQPYYSLWEFKDIKP